MATTALVFVAQFGGAGLARATDATWLANPSTNFFDHYDNWDTGVVPWDTAFFGVSATTNLLLASGYYTFGGWTFNAGASDYTITFAPANSSWPLSFEGAGIVVNGGSVEFISGGVVSFANTSSAGTATIRNDYILSFWHDSTAGSAVITNNGGMDFTQSATAGDATIYNNGGLTFRNNSTAGNARLVNEGSIDFSPTNGPHNDRRVSAGSIEGSGTIYLGANELTVGSNGLSTEVSGVIRGDGGSLVKTGSGTLTLSGENAYTGGTTVLEGTLKAGGAGAFVGDTAYAIQGGTLDLNGFDLTMAKLSGTGGVLDIGAADLTVDQAVDTLYSGEITGSGSLVKRGTGTLTLGGESSYTGETVIEAGTLALAGSGLEIASSAVVRVEGGTFDVSATASSLALITSLTGPASGTVRLGGAVLFISDASGEFAGVIEDGGEAGGLALAGGTLTLSGANTYTNATVLGGYAKLALKGAGSIAASGYVGFDSGGTLDISQTAAGASIGALYDPCGCGMVELGAQTLTITGGSVFVGTIADGGIAGGTGGNLVIADGAEQELGGINSYTGTTRIEAGGSLLLSGAGGIETSSSVTVDGTLDLSLMDYNANPTIRALAGSGAIYLGDEALHVREANGAFTGTVSDCGPEGLSCYGGYTGGSLVLEDGTLTLSGANIHTGGTTIGGMAADPAATLIARNSAALGTGKTLINGSGTLQAGADGLDLANDIELTDEGGTIDTAGFEMTVSGSLTNADWSTGALVKTGAGTLRLTGDNDYGGTTTVAAGTLLVDGFNAYSSLLTVEEGATLGGSGFVGDTLVEGTLAAGSSAGTLTVRGDLTLASSSTSIFELTQPNVAGNDLVVVTGDLTLGGTLQAADLVSGYFRLFQVNGAISGSFDTLDTDGTLFVGTNQVALLMESGGQSVQFWDGSDDFGNGEVEGGSGTWSAGNTNWAAAPGTGEVNGPWRGEVAVFTGESQGEVTVEGPVAFQGLQFTDHGYRISGDALTMLGNPEGNAQASFITVDSGAATISAPLTGDGIGLDKLGSGTLVLSGANTYTGTTTVSAGWLQAGSAGAFVDGGRFVVESDAFLDLRGFDATFSDLSGEGAVTLNGATLTLDSEDDGTFAGQMSGFGQFVKAGTGTFTILGSGFSAANGIVVEDGVLKVGSANSLSSPSSLIVNGGKLDLGGFDWTMRSLAGTGGELALGSGTLTLIQSGDTEFSGAITGTGGLAFLREGTLVLSGDNTYTGGTYVREGILRAGSEGGFADHTAYTLTGTGKLDLNGFDLTASALSSSNSFGGTGEVMLGGATLTVVQATNSEFEGVISGAGSLVKTGAGTLFLTNTSTYTGETIVNGGRLAVNGDITSSSLLTIGAGGSVGGTGLLPSVTVATGGTFAPGNSIGTATINGDFAFGADSTYAVEVSPDDADRTNITGTADLSGGTVATTFSPGDYILKQYLILSADGGLGGTTFSGLDGKAPTGFAQSLRYDGDDVYLALELALKAQSIDHFNRNQEGIAAAIIAYYDANGGIAAPFAALDADGMTMASGEAATGAIRAGLESAEQFLGVAASEAMPGTGASALVATHGENAGTIVESRWKAFGSAYGRSAAFDGNAGSGSHDIDADTTGIAGGFARRWNDMVVGVAVGFGSSDFDLSGGLGGGHADNYHAGFFAGRAFGDAYLSAAAAYGYHSVETSRHAGGDRLTAHFSAHSFAGRIEAGARIATPLATLAPYAALQAITYRLPSYREEGGLFALSYEADTTTTLRAELGARLQRDIDLGDGDRLTLAGGAAVAFNGGDTPGFTAGFVDLPGSAFSVEGAKADSLSGLLQASTEYHSATGFFASAGVAGKFSENTRSLAGKGKVGFTW